MSQTAIPAARANATPVTDAPTPQSTIFPPSDTLSQAHASPAQSRVGAGQSDSSPAVSTVDGTGMWKVGG